MARNWPDRSELIPCISSCLSTPDSISVAGVGFRGADVQAGETGEDSGHPAYLWIAGGAGFAGVTALLLRTDEHTYRGTQSWRRESAFVRTVSPVVTQLGQGTIPLALFGGMLAYGAVAGNERADAAAISGLESFALSGVAVQLSKQIVGRERPSISHRPGGIFHAPFSYFRHRRSSVTMYDSFPSGHTSTIFSAATIIADYFPEPAVAWTAYSLATIVGVTRVIERTHWFSDCFVGAAVGMASAKLVEAFHGGTGRYTIGIAPARDGYALGIGIQL